MKKIILLILLYAILVISVLGQGFGIQVTLRDSEETSLSIGKASIYFKNPRR